MRISSTTAPTSAAPSSSANSADPVEDALPSDGRDNPFKAAMDSAAGQAVDGFDKLTPSRLATWMEAARGDVPFDPAADNFPMLDWLDPLTYQMAENVKLPMDSPEELAEVKEAQAERTPDADPIAINLCSTGQNAIWLNYANQYEQEHGKVAGWLCKAELEAVLGAQGVGTLVAKTENREPRPFKIDPTIQLLGPAINSYSYPSGHSASAFAAATVLSHFMPERKDELFAAAANVARSRVYVGAHFPGDTAEGARIGVRFANDVLTGTGQGKVTPPDSRD